MKSLHSYKLASQDCNILTIQPSCEINNKLPGGLAAVTIIIHITNSDNKHASYLDEVKKIIL